MIRHSGPGVLDHSAVGLVPDVLRLDDVRRLSSFLSTMSHRMRPKPDDAPVTEHPLDQSINRAVEGLLSQARVDGIVAVVVLVASGQAGQPLRLINMPRERSPGSSNRGTSSIRVLTHPLVLEEHWQWIGFALKRLPGHEGQTSKCPPLKDPTVTVSDRTDPTLSCTRPSGVGTVCIARRDLGH